MYEVEVQKQKALFVEFEEEEPSESDQNISSMADRVASRVTDFDN